MSQQAENGRVVPVSFKPSSEAFCRAMGHANMNNPYYCDNREWEEVFIQLVEKECEAQCDAVSSMFSKYASQGLENRSFCPPMMNIPYLMQHCNYSQEEAQKKCKEKFCFLFLYNGEVIKSPVKAYSAILNEDMYQAANSLSAFLKKNRDMFFGIGSNKQYSSEPRRGIPEYKKSICEFYIPDEITSGDKVYKCSMYIDINNFSNEISDVIVKYIYEEDFFFLPAYFKTMTQSGKSSHCLFTGRSGKTLHFTNENLFEKYPESTLLFFDNVEVSSYINLLMKESKFLTYENYIPICHYGNLSMVEIDDINFGVAKYRKVVLCPGPSRESYMNMFRYAREFQNVKCESVTVLQFPLLAHSKYVVIPPFVVGLPSRAYAAFVSFIAGVMPPMPM